MNADGGATAIRREFLGWDQPALPRAVERLANTYGRDRELDLGNVLVVVPGQRAGRRLQELLAFHAEQEQLLLTPPEVITEGQLPERLYKPRRPFADEITQDLAWVTALRELGDDLGAVVPSPPSEDDLPAWLCLAAMLRRLHVDLAAEGLDFAKVHENTERLGGTDEAARWEFLDKVRTRYLQLLDDQNLWDQQTARLVAIEKREIACDRDIILLGTVDLTQTVRTMLEQVSDRVTAYIVAPPDAADLFDAFGCIDLEKWTNRDVPLGDEQLEQVDGPIEQADAVASWLHALGGAYRADQIAIGVPDEDLVPQLQRQLEQCGLRSRWVMGKSLGETPAYRLLAAAADFGSTRTHESLAALLRHPDVEQWLVSKIGKRAKFLPGQLDRYYNEYLPRNVPRPAELLSGGKWRDLCGAVKRIDAWLAEIEGSRPLREWGSAFRGILAEIYADRTLDLEKPEHRVLHESLESLLSVCDRLDGLPENFDSASLTAKEAFQIAFSRIADNPVPPPADPDAIEILGWLELPLDDAPALAVTSFNEGLVPSSMVGDAFLPDQVRREIGLLHNQRRYARDAYATTVLSHSRERLHVIFARRNGNDDPLQPSRLLFACDEEAMVRRAERFFDEASEAQKPRRLLLAPPSTPPDKSRFEVPEPEIPAEKPTRFSVTRFKDYLACPYRYYLRHVARIEAVDDEAKELDGATFGTLLHEVLSHLGRERRDLATAGSESEICDYLLDHFADLIRDRFRKAQCRPAIRLQLEQARRRLEMFAKQQVELAREGWRILYAEDAENSDHEQNAIAVPFDVDGEEIYLVGRIDRIDYHDGKKTLRILDYKTADTGKKPEETHRSQGKWIDLQLPLYRRLWRGLPLDLPGVDEIQLGYFNLPKSAQKSGVQLAKWTEADLEGAEEEARRVIRDIRDGKFWPPVYPAPKYSEDLAAICLDKWLHGPSITESETGEGE